jgi:mRNA interferase MazF
MDFQLGDIFLTSFYPSIGKEYQKVRPALVIQDEKISKNSPYITILPITTNLKLGRNPNVFIPRDHKNNLKDDSVIIVRQISSFDKTRFIKKIGEANSPVLRQVRGYLRRHFKL